MAVFGQVLVFTFLALIAQIQLVQSKGLTLVQILKLADSEGMFVSLFFVLSFFVIFYL